MAKKKRSVGSLADELVRKAREAMLTAVQIFNNPQIDFKSELFIVTTGIAWTYLLHAYYRKKKVNYRQIDERAKGKKIRYLRTKRGAIKRWSLEECLKAKQCPLEDIVKKNLDFLIGIRHEIEHQMTTRIDDKLSAKFQAAAINFNTAIKTLFGKKHSLDAEQAFSIQFSGIDDGTAKDLMKESDLPLNIESFVTQYHNGLSQEEFNDSRFSYRVAFIKKTTNSKTAADKVIQFIPAGSVAAEEINTIFVKEVEKEKYRPSRIIKMMQDEGYPNFKQRAHSDLWQSRDAKNPKYSYGTLVEGQWLWYGNWVAEVRKHCQENAEKYSRKILAAL